MDSVGLKKIAIQTCNKHVNRLFGNFINVRHVVEYPKCGGTWAAELIRTCLDIDQRYGNHTFLRPGAVVQLHELYKPYYWRPIVVVRDPRDVLVSFYFYELYFPRSQSGTGSLINFSEDDSEIENLHKYVKEKINNPHRTVPGFSYLDFINSWQDNPYLLVKYEDLQQDTAGQLEQMLRYLNADIDAGKVLASVDKCSFRKQSGGREKGEHDPHSFRRKGIVGDWKNYFDEEISNLVKNSSWGEAIINLGYELNDSWER